MKYDPTEIFEYIKQYALDNHCLLPTMREISDRFGMNSTGTVARYCNDLVKQGKLGKRGGRFYIEEMSCIYLPDFTEGQRNAPEVEALIANIEHIN